MKGCQRGILTTISKSSPTTACHRVVSAISASLDKSVIIIIITTDVADHPEYSGRKDKKLQDSKYQKFVAAALLVKSRNSL